MAGIQVLPRAVAERIAAGEVIERPSSVVKELVENSLDAGSSEIAIILEDGGKQLIEIVDNGHGIPPQELPVAVKRHATSKLRTLEDLDRIHTLGFRGEALPSIAAVSELQILSRSEDGASAWELDLGSRYLGGDDLADSDARIPSASPVTFGHFLGSARGTRIRARGLFSQVPARLKFLKSQGAEVSNVRDWLERIAITHPQVGFKLVSDDRTILTLRPQSEEERVRAILADGEDFPLVSWQTEDPTASVKLRIHWLQGLSAPNTRRLVQIVNCRAVRDRLLQQSVLSAFRQALLPGQFPAVALFLDVSPDRIDVNVHPTKSEVRFIDSGKVFREVSMRLEAMISGHGAPAWAAGEPGSFGGAGQWNLSSGDVLDRPSTPASHSPNSRAMTPQQFDFRSPPLVSTTDPAADPSDHLPGQLRVSCSSDSNPNAGSPINLHPFDASRFTGILFNTYLMYDLGGELGLIDQHAAHERVRYERLKARALGRAAAPQPQQLLIPESIAFVREQRSELERKIDWLSKMGFEVEIFGEDKALFRAIPSEWGTQELRLRLKGLIDRVLAAEVPGHQLALDESLFERLASEACHSSIRAGDRIDPTQAAALIDDLFRCDHPWNCPHGRPTVARIPRARFEEWFQRRV